MKYFFFCVWILRRDQITIMARQTNECLEDSSNSREHTHTKRQRISSVCLHFEKSSHEHFYSSQSFPFLCSFMRQPIKNMEEYLDELTITIRWLAKMTRVREREREKVSGWGLASSFKQRHSLLLCLSFFCCWRGVIVFRKFSFTWHKYTDLYRSNRRNYTMDGTSNCIFRLAMVKQESSSMSCKEVHKFYTKEIRWMSKSHSRLVSDAIDVGVHRDFVTRNDTWTLLRHSTIHNWKQSIIVSRTCLLEKSDWSLSFRFSRHWICRIEKGSPFRI